MNVHECDCVATVTDDKLFVVLGQNVNGVDSDISARGGEGWLKGVRTLCRLQVPQLERERERRIGRE